MKESREVVYLMGYIKVGVNADGNLAVSITGMESLKKVGLLDQFNRAAAAFLREFSKGETLKRPVLRQGNLEAAPDVEAVSDELELEMAAHQMEGGSDAETKA